MNSDGLEEDPMLLDAFIDDELDASRSLELQRRLAGDPAIRAALDARRALRAAVRDGATYHAAPQALRQRLALAQVSADEAAFDLSANDARMPRERDVDPTPRLTSPVARRPRPALRPRPWWPVAAGSAALGALAASEAVSAHTRALLIGQPIEVASSDQHTVRPWLSARLNFVPPVADLASRGYELVGARRDVIAGAVAAALVYRHGAHLVSAFVRPVNGAGEARAGRPPTLRAVRGFNVVETVRGGMAWCIVSDMNATELRQFAEMLSEPIARAASEP